MKIVVVGSFMMDLVVQTPRAPKKGETVMGTHLARFPGGKGANQAVAAARLGGNVTMIGKVGKDQFGEEMIQTLQKEQIETQHILQDEVAPTGVGLIVLDENYDNRIVVVPGANLAYSLNDLSQVERVIQQADLLMLQLEMDRKIVEQSVRYAHQHQVSIMLNPAPAQSLSDELLQQVTYLTPNETEAEILTGKKVQNIDDAKASIAELLKKGAKHVVITLAEAGAVMGSKEGIDHIEGFSVQPKDTVAAGDAFHGAFAVAMVHGKSFAESVRFANAAGALATTKEGAIPSLPYLAEVTELIEENRS